jgi:RNA polymerase sigma-70 factor, ECF subfamily
MDNDTLLDRLADGLDEAFEDLVRGHQDRLYAIALRMLANPADAEEVTQDALVRAYRALATYQPQRIRELRLRGWLATILIRLCRSRAVRRTPRTVTIEIDRTDLLAARADETPHLHLDGKESRQRWASLLANLPERYRAAVVLRHVDGLTYPEITEALGRPEGTIKAQVHRGLALLRAAFEAAEREESIA